MKEIIIYESEDGTRSGDIDFIRRCDAECDQIESMTSKYLEPAPDDLSFSNGRGYIQHDGSLCLIFLRKILDIVLSYVGEKKNGSSVLQAPDWLTWINDTPDKSKTQMLRVLMGRVSNCEVDKMPRSVIQALRRLQRIDYQWREWGQPYYANHPSSGDQVKLNAN